MYSGTKVVMYLGASEVALVSDTEVGVFSGSSKAVLFSGRMVELGITTTGTTGGSVDPGDRLDLSVIFSVVRGCVELSDTDGVGSDPE